MSGVLIVEAIFVLPGVATTLLDAVGNRDQPVILAGAAVPPGWRRSSSTASSIWSVPAWSWVRAADMNRLARVTAAAMVAVPLAVALIGPYVARFAPQEPQSPFGPSTWSWFGTDRLGRDVLAAALTGGRPLIVTAAITVVGAYTIRFALVWRLPRPEDHGSTNSSCARSTSCSACPHFWS
ncbi:MAG: hypothetical protein U5N53_22870 [Mycobacterium sp.]|nr:hypothetical protein [Mycobacterium sp.]